MVLDPDNDVVKSALAEDVVDIQAFEDRATEPLLDFEELVKDLQQRGKI